MSGLAERLPAVDAVIDALHETHGVSHIDMPCTPARVWAAMQGRPEPPQ